MLGALGVYRAAFATIAQTEPLTLDKVQVPIVALGGDKANGARVRARIELVAENVSGGVIEGCGHFVGEERPDEVIRQVLERLG